MLTVLGGKEVMLEIPFLDEIVMEKIDQLKAIKDGSVSLDAALNGAPS